MLLLKLLLGLLLLLLLLRLGLKLLLLRLLLLLLLLQQLLLLHNTAFWTCARLRRRAGGGGWRHLRRLASIPLRRGWSRRPLVRSSGSVGRSGCARRDWGLLARGIRLGSKLLHASLRLRLRLSRLLPAHFSVRAICRGRRRSPRSRRRLGLGLGAGWRCLGRRLSHSGGPRLCLLDAGSWSLSSLSRWRSCRGLRIPVLRGLSGNNRSGSLGGGSGGSSRRLRTPVLAGLGSVQGWTRLLLRGLSANARPYRLLSSGPGRSASRLRIPVLRSLSANPRHRSLCSGPRRTRKLRVPGLRRPSAGNRSRSLSGEHRRSASSLGIPSLRRLSSIPGCGTLSSRPRRLGPGKLGVPVLGRLAAVHAWPCLRLGRLPTRRTLSLGGKPNRRSARELGIPVLRRLSHICCWISLLLGWLCTGR